MSLVIQDDITGEIVGGTDIVLLEVLLNQFNIPYERDENETENYIAITLKKGFPENIVKGYFNFFCEFIFNRDKKTIKEVGIWEE